MSVGTPAPCHHVPLHCPTLDSAGAHGVVDGVHDWWMGVGSNVGHLAMAPAPGFGIPQCRDWMAPILGLGGEGVFVPPMRLIGCHCWQDWGAGGYQEGFYSLWQGLGCRVGGRYRGPLFPFSL